MATKGAIPVKVSLANLPEVQGAYATIKVGYVNRLVKTGATKGARKTVPTVKSNLRKHRRFGQLEKSLGVKYAGYKLGWTVLLGPRRFFRGSSSTMMSPKAPTIDPAKYAHLLEGGRKEVESKRISLNGRGAMPIFVKRLDFGIRPRGGRLQSPGRLTTFGRRGKKATADRFRKVPGGWLIFATRAKAAPAYPWLVKGANAYGSNIVASVKSEITNGLPSLVAKARAGGRSAFKPSFVENG